MAANAGYVSTHRRFIFLTAFLRYRLDPYTDSATLFATRIDVAGSGVFICASHSIKAEETAVTQNTLLILHQEASVLGAQGIVMICKERRTCLQDKARHA